MNAALPALQIEADAALSYERRVRILTQLEPNVRGHASRYVRVSPRGVGLEDLVAVGMAAAWEALVRRPAEVEPSPYLKCRIRGAIVDFIRAQYRSSRESLRAEDDEDGSPATSFGEPDGTLTPEALLDHVRSTEHLLACVSALPPRERQIVEARYFDDAALNGVAVEMGVSGPRISQMHHRALRRLRRWLTDEVGLPEAAPAALA